MWTVGFFDLWTLPSFVVCALAYVLFFVAAFPPLNLWPLIIFAPAPLAWIALAAPTMRAAMLCGGLASLLAWYIHGFWLVQITELGYPFYAPYLALYTLLFVWIIRRLHLQPPSRHVSSHLHRLPLTLTLPIVWVGLELLRGSLLFGGYPWYFLAHPLIELPLLVQSADLFGAYFISFLAAMVSGLLIDLWRVRTDLTPRRIGASSAATIVVIWLGNLAYGAWRIQQPVVEPGPAMLVIQTNLPQDNKMRATSEERMDQFESFMYLTIDAIEQNLLVENDVDLVIWPETMVFGFGFDQGTIDYVVREQWFPTNWPLRNLEAVIQYFDVPMLVGTQAYIGLRVENKRFEADEIYNSGYLLERDGTRQRYDKIHLTPFGETMPYFSRWPRLEERLLVIAARGMRFDLHPGTDDDPLMLQWNDRTLALALPICFEITVPHICRRLVNADGEKRADVLINLTNDGWFGWFDAGRTQHAQISRFRAIEHRVPVVRAANTGLSVQIDSHGRMVAGIGHGRYGEPRQEGSLLARIDLDPRNTLFGRIGDLWAWLCLLGTVGLIFGSWIGTRRS